MISQLRGTCHLLLVCLPFVTARDITSHNLLNNGETNPSMHIFPGCLPLNQTVVEDEQLKKILYLYRQSGSKREEYQVWPGKRYNAEA